MDDLISRKAAIDALRDAENHAFGSYYKGLIKAHKIVADLPFAQPEVIRCKDCKYRTSYWGNCKFGEEKYHQSVLVDSDDFCSRAKRRINE